MLGTALAGTLPAPKRAMAPILAPIYALADIFMMPSGFLNAMWLSEGIMSTIGIMGGYLEVETAAVPLIRCLF